MWYHNNLRKCDFSLCFQVLVFPGVLLSTQFARETSISNGGPLGELLQWADLIGALHVLGHNVTVEENPKAATVR